MFFEYISKASSNPCGQQRAFEGKSSFDLGFFLVSRPDVVGAGLQTHSLQRFPLSHFPFLFKYSLHSSCSSWFHSFPTAGMKHEASALIQSSHTLGVRTLNSPFPLSFSWELLETNPCRSNISLFLSFGRMTKMEARTTWLYATSCLWVLSVTKAQIRNSVQETAVDEAEIDAADACSMWPHDPELCGVSLCVLCVIEHVKGLFQQFITCLKGKFTQKFVENLFRPSKV